MSALVEIEEFLAVPRRLLKYFGIVVMKRGKELIFNQGILFYFAFSNMILIEFFEIAYCYLSLTRKIEFDLQENMSIGICLCYQTWSLFKSLPLISKKDKIYAVLSELRSIHPKTADDQKKYEIVECIKSMKTIMFHYSWVLVCMVSVYSSMPFLDVLKVYFTYGEWEVDFTYYIWYPFNAYRRGVFELCFMTLCYDAVCASVYIIGGDLFMFGILTQISMQYDFMKREFLAMKYQQKTKWNFKLKELLKLHVRVNKYVLQEKKTFIFRRRKNSLFVCLFCSVVEELNDIFEVSNIFHFIWGSGAICCVGFLVIVNRDMSGFIRYPFSLATILMQLFSVGWMGDNLMRTVSCLSYIFY